MAGRYVLNQPRQTLERYFGGYWTRLTHHDADQVTRVTYTYSPRGIRRIFPQVRQAAFAITYVGDRAQTVHMSAIAGDDEQGFTYGQREAARFFQYVFGYQPPIWNLVSDRFTGNETIHDYVYCLGDGVATGFTLGGAQQFLLGEATLYYDLRCEPPYRFEP